MPVAAKTLKSALHYCSWGGLFVDPDEQPELFKLLPGWRRREVLFIRKCRAAGYIPTREEISQAVNSGALGTVHLVLSDTLTLASLRRVGVLPVSSDLIATLSTCVTEDTVSEHCTALGNGDQLSAGQPSHGLYAYLWAVARVKKGMAESLPLAYLFELEDGVRMLTGVFYNLRDEVAAPVLSWLNDLADQLCAGV